MRTFFLVLLATACSDGFGDGGETPNDKGDTAGDNDGDTGKDTDSGQDTDTGQDTGADPDDVDDDGDGVTENEGDCDDHDGDVSPDEREVPYNGADDDCDEGTPDDDLDGDGYDADTDCDDRDADTHPAADELPYNGADDDCDERTPDDDLDGDGAVRADDCDEDRADVGPDADEVRGDGVDHDCDGDTDEPFEVQALDSSGDVGFPSAVGVDSIGSVHVVYRDVSRGVIRHTTDESGAWAAGVDIVTDTETGESLDLVVDGADQLQIAYTWTSGAYTDLWFGYRDGSGVWDVGYAVDGYALSGSLSTGWYVSIDVDSDNLPSFAYYDDTYLVPRLADYTSFGVGVYTDVDVWYYWTNYTGAYTSLAIDSEDYDHVAWTDDNAINDEGQYADYNEVTVNETIADDAIWLSLALQADDTACVAYHDAVSADLEYACRDASTETWSPVTVDSTGSVGLYAQLAFDSADQPWVAYYDQSNGDLKVAANLGGAWTTWTVDDDGDVGIAPSLAIGVDDRVHVTYYDLTNGVLKYAQLNE